MLFRLNWCIWFMIYHTPLSKRFRYSRKLLYHSPVNIFGWKWIRYKYKWSSRRIPWRISMKPLDVLNYLCQNNLIFIRIPTALRILLTLPVSVLQARRERIRFSKLKLSKHYSRSSIKLRNMTLISTESIVAASLDQTSLINEFAKAKVRGIKL